MALYQNKYRVEPARLKNWDYSSAAAYFVTVCTLHRTHFFGTVHNDEMILNEIGSIVETEWIKTQVIRPDMKLILDAFIVMPNHFHAIIFIGDGLPLIEPMPNKFGPQSKNLGSIMRGFKSSVTTQARIVNPYFGWQARYHDHIIRDDASFIRIHNYIINNPKNWKDDTFFKS